jgi:hypothetical protein
MHPGRYSATVWAVDETLTAEIVAAEAELRGPSPDAWFDRLDGEAEAVDMALESALEHDHEQGLSLGGAVWPYWMARGKVKIGRDWLGRLLEASEWGERTEARAKALYGAGMLAFSEGDREPSLRLHTESLAIAREHRSLPLEADALIGLACVSLLDGNALVMQQHAQASLEAARAAGDEQRVAMALQRVDEAKRLEAAGGPGQGSAVAEVVDVADQEPAIPEATDVPGRETAVAEVVDVADQEPAIPDAADVPDREAAVPEPVDVPESQPPA